MSYHLFISLYCLILAQSVHSMEHTSKEDHLPKITSDFYKELSRTETNSSPPKKNHKKNLLSIFTQSDAEPHSSTTKISPRKLEIVEDNSKTSPKVSPRKPDNIGRNKNKISPRKLEIVENNSKTSPKSSPRKSDNIDYNKNKISPRKFEIVEDNSKTSPKVSPRRFIKTMDNSNNIENIATKRSPELPELPRSRSHSLHADKHSIHNKLKRTVKSKSTNDKTTLIYTTKSSKDLSFSTDDTITAEAYSPKEKECKSNNPTAKRLSLSDSIIDNPMHPSQSNSSSSLCNNEDNITITPSSSLIKTSKDYSLGKFFSKSSGTTDNRSRTSPIKSSKPLIIAKNDIINAVRSKDINIIKKCIDNLSIDLNKQNEFGMTALHFAALNAIQTKNDYDKTQTKDNCDKAQSAIAIINLLLSDPRVDSSLKNNNSLAAGQLIKGTDNCEEARTIFFGRFLLDQTVFQEMFVMLIDLHIKNQLLNDELINKTAKIVKKKIRHTESSQGSSELPEEALLHAKKSFIAEMILQRIPKDAATTTNLITAIHKEIHALLFNVEINNTMIHDSVEMVKKTFSETASPRENSHKKLKELCLPKYADYNFIFNVILSYTQKQKSHIKPSFLDMIPQETATQAITETKDIVIIHKTD